MAWYNFGGKEQNLGSQLPLGRLWLRAWCLMPDALRWRQHSELQ